MVKEGDESRVEERTIMQDKKITTRIGSVEVVHFLVGELLSF